MPTPQGWPVYRCDGSILDEKRLVDGISFASYCLSTQPSKVISIGERLEYLFDEMERVEGGELYCSLLTVVVPSFPIWHSPV